MGLTIMPCNEETHKWEFMEDAHGMLWKRCVNCGEPRYEYQDTQGG